MNSTYRLGDSGNSARAAVNQPTLTAEWEDRDYTGLVREPDAGNPPVRFDERGVETEYGHPTMPPRHTSTLLLILAASSFLLPFLLLQDRRSRITHGVPRTKHAIRRPTSFPVM